MQCWLDPGLLLWSLLLVFWSPFALLHRLRRTLFRSKHDPYVKPRWTGGLQTPELTREMLGGAGTHVVLVGASFGEVLLIDKVTKALKGDRPDLKVTWAIRDRNTVEHVLKEHPAQSVVFWPYDWLLPVVRWLKAVRPDLVVMFERFRFPILVRASMRYGADVVLVNGRCKPRKLGYAVGWLYYRWLFRGFRTLLFQNDQDLATAMPMVGGRTKAEAAGDIKFDLTRVPIDPDKAAAVDVWIASAGESPVLAAGSTDDSEEEAFVLDAFMAVRNRHDARLMIAPREPARAGAVAEAVEERGLTVSHRSEMDGDADVYILDTFGELAYAYKFAVAAYVGGSLLGMGHNVIEPLDWGVPVSYGPNRGHFRAMQEECEAAGVGTRIREPSQLADLWSNAIASPEGRETTSEQCRTMLAQNRGALDVTLKELARLLEKRGSQTGG